jgi:hypothetical protein
MIAYGIIEEAYLLYKKGWIDKYTWDQWAAWLKSLSIHPQFNDMHSATNGMFDKDYQEFVSKMLEER